MQKSCCRLQNTSSSKTIHTQFALVNLNWHEPMAKWFLWVALSRGTWVLYHRVLKPVAAPWPFCVALSPSVHWHGRFLYCCALYDFFFLGFCQWRSLADRVLTLNMSIWLPLFWSTAPLGIGLGATGPGLGNMCWPGKLAWLQRL